MTLMMLLPELYLVITLAGLVFGEIGYHGERVRLVGATALIGLAGAFIQTWITFGMGPARILHDTLVVSGFSLFIQLLAIGAAALAVIVAMQSEGISRSRKTEFYALIVGGALAISVGAAADDLLLIFVSIQLLNVIAFLMAGYGNESVWSVEAGFKHLAFGVVSGGLFLFGLSLLFHSTHTLGLHEMHQALLKSPLSSDANLVIFMMFFLSFSFLLGAFPMNLGFADIIEGSPTPASWYIAIATRLLAFPIALRVILLIFAQPTAGQATRWEVLGQLNWTQIVALSSGMTLLMGALMAFRQVRAKRLVAFLTMAEAGALLLGFLVLDQNGLAALFYHLLLELLALAGIYYVIDFIQKEMGTDRLESLGGLISRATAECISLIFFLGCLIGVPPFPGFFGKFTLIGIAIEHHYYLLAGLAMTAWAISTIAMGRLAFSFIGAGKIEGENTQAVPSSHDARRRWVLLALALVLVLAGVFAQRVLGWIGQSLQFILW